MATSAAIAKIIFAIVISSFLNIQVNANCVWYDQCGDDPDYSDGLHGLNCVYNGPAIKVGIYY